MIFSDSPQQKALERMMTTVPNFRPRGSGVMVLHSFEYTAEMCDCRLCLYYNRKRKCTVSHCPCIEERILAGAASRAEVMAETMKNIHNAAFRRRLNQFIIPKRRKRLSMILVCRERITSVIAALPNLIFLQILKNILTLCQNRATILMLTRRQNTFEEDE